MEKSNKALAFDGVAKVGTMPNGFRPPAPANNGVEVDGGGGGGVMYVVGVTIVVAAPPPPGGIIIPPAALSIQKHNIVNMMLIDLYVLFIM
ncbi:hypothetical protein Hanom_Chr00s140800g01818871 [Helianthus anomalus]